jgi:hypothetical protein
MTANMDQQHCAEPLAMRMGPMLAGTQVATFRRYGRQVFDDITSVAGVVPSAKHSKAIQAQTKQSRKNSPRRAISIAYRLSGRDQSLPKVYPQRHSWTVGFGEGFLMRVAAIRCARARLRPALENLPRRKPRGAWIDLWGKCADVWSDGCVWGLAEGVHDG